MQLWSDLVTLVVIDTIPFKVLLIVVTLRPITKGLSCVTEVGLWFNFLIS